MAIAVNPVLEGLRERVALLPDLPGVYQYFDAAGVIIYVGKAKNLKKRVSSYFNRELEYTKTMVLVSKIRDIRHIVVESEDDALLLENNLIKEYQPRYNIRLKDDKTYPWLVVKNEAFPRVFSTRNLIRDGSSYYGPYTSVTVLRALQDIIKQLYKLRTCSLSLTRENIRRHKFKLCLEYHIGNCKAPCEAMIGEEEYAGYVDQIRGLLKGNVAGVISSLKAKMTDLADLYLFEEAQELKEKIAALERFQAKSTIVNPSIHDVDVFSIVEGRNVAYVNFLKVINGAIIQTYSVELKKRLEESLEEMLQFAIVEIRSKFDSTSPEILVPFKIEYALKNTRFTVPVIGDKKKLLDLSERNAKYFQLERLKQYEKQNPDAHLERILDTMQHDLHLSEKPVHIECFDNSNLQGTHPVASCVVFRNAKPSVRDYRHFNIKTVEGPNDFASMEEIVYRRYKRMLEEGSALPQLVVVDGGKGQLSAAMKSIEKLDLVGKLAIVGIAKRLEEIFYPGDPVPLYIDKNSVSLKVIQHIRDEAHRFGITFHRSKRSKSMVVSELDGISGLGPKTIELLMNKFKSINHLKKAQLSDIQDVIGKAKGLAVYSHFNSQPTAGE